jgi:hypothetical protein
LIFLMGRIVPYLGKKSISIFVLTFNSVRFIVSSLTDCQFFSLASCAVRKGGTLAALWREPPRM